jgi:hypothetical protein
MLSFIYLAIAKALLGAKAVPYITLHDNSIIQTTGQLPLPMVLVNIDRIDWQVQGGSSSMGTLSLELLVASERPAREGIGGQGDLDKWTQSGIDHLRLLDAVYHAVEGLTATDCDQRYSLGPLRRTEVATDKAFDRQKFHSLFFTAHVQDFSRPDGKRRATIQFDPDAEFIPVPTLPTGI